MAERQLRPRRAGGPGAAALPRLLVRGRRPRPLGGRPAADRGGVGAGGRLGRGAGGRPSSPGARAGPTGAPTSTSSASGRRRSGAFPDGAAPTGCLADDRRRLGVDGHRASAGTRASAPSPTRSTPRSSSATATACCAAARGPPSPTPRAPPSATGTCPPAPDLRRLPLAATWRGAWRPRPRGSAGRPGIVPACRHLGRAGGRAGRPRARAAALAPRPELRAARAAARLASAPTGRAWAGTPMPTRSRPTYRREEPIWADPTCPGWRAWCGRAASSAAVRNATHGDPGRPAARAAVPQRRPTSSPTTARGRVRRARPRLRDLLPDDLSRVADTAAATPRRSSCSRWRGCARPAATWRRACAPPSPRWPSGRPGSEPQRRCSPTAARSPRAARRPAAAADSLHLLVDGARFPGGTVVASEPLDDDPGWEPRAGGHASSCVDRRDREPDAGAGRRERDHRQPRAAPPTPAAPPGRRCPTASTCTWPLRRAGGAGRRRPRRAHRHPEVAAAEVLLRRPRLRACSRRSPSCPSTTRPARSWRSCCATAPGIVARHEPTELVELGSGSSHKTRALLDAMRDEGLLRRYLPFDISPERAAGRRRPRWPRTTPACACARVAGDFERHLDRIPAPRRRRPPPGGLPRRHDRQPAPRRARALPALGAPAPAAGGPPAPGHRPRGRPRRHRGRVQRRRRRDRRLQPERAVGAQRRARRRPRAGALRARGVLRPRSRRGSRCACARARRTWCACARWTWRSVRGGRGDPHRALLQVHPGQRERMYAEAGLELLEWHTDEAERFAVSIAALA